MVGSLRDECVRYALGVFHFWHPAESLLSKRFFGNLGETLETLHSLAYGFSICLQPINLLYCFLGVLMGTLVGVLPGLGPAAAISLLLPTIFHVPALASIVMLCGICYGAA